MMNYHFIGIKGSGMSSLAQILHDLGNHVQGSDVEQFFFTQKALEDRAIPLLPFDPKNITGEHIVIVGNAFKDDHVEVAACIENHIPFIRYHAYLTSFMKTYNSIAVSGAHGKTTTTGLLSHVLSTLTPTSYLIGDGTGKGVAGSTHFVFEACEYRRHFLAYEPNYAIITNIDFDHPDYFSGIEDVKDAFGTFAKQTKEKVIACGEDSHVNALFDQTNAYLYGFNEAFDVVASNVQVDPTGTSFDVVAFGQPLGRFMIPLHGNHQILNTLAVITVAKLEEYDMTLVKKALQTYTGVNRRFTESVVNTNVLIDDYAHHPTEIKATLEAVKKKYPDRKVVAIFQPHTFSRTQTFIEEFATSFDEADAVYFVDIFGSAREKEGSLTVHDVIKKTKNAHHLTMESVQKLTMYDHAVLVFMGAGDINTLQKAYEQLV